MPGEPGPIRTQVAQQRAKWRNRALSGAAAGGSRSAVQEVAQSADNEPHTQPLPINHPPKGPELDNTDLCPPGLRAPSFWHVAGPTRSIAGVLESYGALEQRISQELDEEGALRGVKPPSLGRTNVVRWRSCPHWGRKPPTGAGYPPLGQANYLPQCTVTCPNAL